LASTARFQNQHEDEDLIQKVSDLHFPQQPASGDEAKRSTRPGREKRDRKQARGCGERPPLTSLQLAILVREKLHKECIHLGSPPFCSKVRLDISIRRQPFDRFLTPNS
jgi:hypothetical protein